jgi:hypothetical protein
MRGRVCNFHAIIHWLESCRTYNHILLSHLRLPQPGEPAPHIYILQEQGGPVIPPGTGFHFCCLLRLIGLQWRYSNLLPHEAELTNKPFSPITFQHGPHKTPFTRTEAPVTPLAKRSAN